ncbi:hypothetical protein [Sciscionella sp. SE31]|uniref:hypothetical protein n=1 Tax=Sciscionella sediminilitoris TaxID=1445613 RepID=UPI0012E0ED72
MTNRGVLGQPLADGCVFVRGVVAHHQVQLDWVTGIVNDVTVGPLDLLEER